MFGHLPSQNEAAPTLSGKQVVVVQPQSLVTAEVRYPSGQLTVELTQLQAHSYSSQHWVLRRVGVRCGGQEGGDSLLHSSFLQAEGQNEVTSPSCHTGRYAQLGFISIQPGYKIPGNSRPQTVKSKMSVSLAWGLRDFSIIPKSSLQEK